MAGFEEKKAELEAVGASIVAASVDTGEHSQEVAKDVSFSVAEGVTRDMADALGSWWEDRRGIVQPSEFIVNADGKIMMSSYSSGPLARLDPGDVIKLINFLEARK